MRNQITVTTTILLGTVYPYNKYISYNIIVNNVKNN